MVVTHRHVKIRLEFWEAESRLRGIGITIFLSPHKFAISVCIPHSLEFVLPLCCGAGSRYTHRESLEKKGRGGIILLSSSTQVSGIPNFFNKGLL